MTIVNPFAAPSTMMPMGNSMATPGAIAPMANPGMAPSPMAQSAAPTAGPDPQSYATLKQINDQQNANQVMFLTFQSKISLSDKVYQICLGQIRNMEK